VPEDEREEIAKFIAEAPAKINELENKNAGLQAKIDLLMLEYCPDEMTDEQLENYEKHQVPVDLEGK
jgi:short-subunit dehydrogenase involved in D-alanine esterification of teichoic acids